MPHKLAISIINFRTAEMTLQCIQSVLDDLGDIDGRIVVVDNLSDDGSVEVIEGWIDAQSDPIPVRLIRSHSNSGFSGGHNQGIASIGAEFYLLLNSDALLRPGFLKAILASADAQPQAGLFVPRLEDENGGAQTSCFRFHSPVSEFIRGANSGPVTRILKRYEVALGPDPDPNDIEWVSFACILLRDKMVQAIGSMDEGYFLYYEDTEYCLRAQQAGWKAAYVSKAIAVHFCGGSGPVPSLSQTRKRLPAYLYHSRARFLYQAHGWVGLFFANCMWIAGRALAQLRRLFGKSVQPSIKMEWRDIWTNILAPLGSREAPKE